MTIDTKSALFKAILSMDSYNRGYNAGIVFGSDPSNSEAINGVTQIGDATVVRSANGITAKAAGFYAIAYKLPDSSVTISYRGTDQLTTHDGIGGDVTNAYGIAIGDTDTPQGLAAFQFYKDVAGTLNPVNPDAYQANISVTGHSLGGGLAGLVGKVYGKDGVIFDNMPFNTAADNTYNLLPSPQAPPEASGLSAYLY